MTDTVIVSSNAEETEQVAAAATEAVADAFRQGVNEGAIAAARDQDDADELRREVASLRAEVEQLRGAAGVALATSDAAVEIAIEAAETAEAATDDAPEGEPEGDGPRPPEKREEPAAPDAPATSPPASPPASSEPRGYGAKSWFGARSG